MQDSKITVRQVFYHLCLIDRLRSVANIVYVRDLELSLGKGTSGTLYRTTSGQGGSELLQLLVSQSLFESEHVSPR